MIMQYGVIKKFRRIKIGIQQKPTGTAKPQKISRKMKILLAGVCAHACILKR